MTYCSMILLHWSVALIGVLLAEAATAGKPAPNPPNPKLVYTSNSDDIEVSNSDGSWRTVLKKGCYHSPTTCYHTRPTWQPSAGDSGSYLVVYESPICRLRQLRVQATATSVQVQPSSDVALALPLGITSGCAPNFSPDGTELVFGEGPTEPPQISSIFIMTFESSGPQGSSIYDAPAGKAVTFATFSSDGKQVAFAETGNSSPYLTSIQLLSKDAQGMWPSATNAAPTPILSENSGFGARFLEWSPTSPARLAFDDGAGSVYIMEIGGIPTKIASGEMPTWSADGQYLFIAASTGVARIDVSSHVTTSIIKGAARPKYRRCLSATSTCP